MATYARRSPIGADAPPSMPGWRDGAVACFSDIGGQSYDGGDSKGGGTRASSHRLSASHRSQLRLGALEARLSTSDSRTRSAASNGRTSRSSGRGLREKYPSTESLVGPTFVRPRRLSSPGVQYLILKGFVALAPR